LGEIDLIQRAMHRTAQKALNALIIGEIEKTAHHL